MKRTAFALALLLGGAAMAEPMTVETDLNPDASVVQSENTPPSPIVDNEVEMTTTDQSIIATDDSIVATQSSTAQTEMASMTPASSAVVAPSNTNPEHDARGIAVLSDAATVPGGWNGVSGTATGGPLLDPATGTPAAGDSYPACSATVTDNCLQTYERGRSS